MATWGELDMNPDNTYIVSYPNDLMDGILWEDETQYAFISAHTEGYDGLLETLDDMGVGWFSIEADTDLTQPPHSWVIKSIANLIVKTAEAELA